MESCRFSFKIINHFFYTIKNLNTLQVLPLTRQNWLSQMLPKNWASYSTFTHLTLLSLAIALENSSQSPNFQQLPSRKTRWQVRYSIHRAAWQCLSCNKLLVSFTSSSLQFTKKVSIIRQSCPSKKKRGGWVANSLQQGFDGVLLLAWTGY